MSLESEQLGEADEPFYRGGVDVGRFHISSDGIWGWLTVLPVLILYLMIAVGPILFALYASFTDARTILPLATWDFIGFENYLQVFDLPLFWESMYRGIVFMVGSTVIQTAVGIWMALALNKVEYGKKILSTVVFTAYLIPTIIVALIGRYMFDETKGILHAVGSGLGLWEGAVLGTGGHFPIFGGATSMAMAILILISSWKFSVFVTIFVLAQLRGIPDRFYEAAKICGATTWEMFRDITLPRIWGALLVAVLLRSIFMFNKFDIIAQVTNGGPGTATMNLPYMAYDTLRSTGDYGLVNALAVVMFLFLFLGAFAYLVALNPSDEVET
jgi:multiple sugar transport system permease protein